MSDSFKLIAMYTKNVTHIMYRNESQNCISIMIPANFIIRTEEV